MGPRTECWCQGRVVARLTSGGAPCFPVVGPYALAWIRLAQEILLAPVAPPGGTTSVADVFHPSRQCLLREAVRQSNRRCPPRSWKFARSGKSHHRRV